MLRKIEEFANRLSDMDWGWWPLRSLRPARDQEISQTLILKLCAFHATAVGLLFAGLYAGRAATPTLPGGTKAFIFGWFIFYLCYKYLCVPFWNHRARRLQGRRPKF